MNAPEYTRLEGLRCSKPLFAGGKDQVVLSSRPDHVRGLKDKQNKNKHVNQYALKSL